MIEAKAGEGAEPGAFSCSEDGRTWHFRGRLTFDDAARVLRSVDELPLPKARARRFLGPAGGRLLRPRGDRWRCGAVPREAHHHRLVFERLPPGLLALAQLYGVDELLGLSPAA